MSLVAIHTSGWESFFQFLSVTFVFVFVLALTYFVSKWIAKYQKGIQVKKNIQVVETFRIANNKYIQILEVGKRYMVIAVGKDTVTMLGELNPEDLNWMPDEYEESVAINENFQEILKKLKDKLPRK